jgi:hypothetical protein
MVLEISEAWCVAGLEIEKIGRLAKLEIRKNSLGGLPARRRLCFFVAQCLCNTIVEYCSPAL